jgi:hypothetical protein
MEREPKFFVGEHVLAQIPGCTKWRRAVIRSVNKKYVDRLSLSNEKLGMLYAVDITGYHLKAALRWEKELREFPKESISKDE